MLSENLHLAFPPRPFIRPTGRVNVLIRYQVSRWVVCGSYYLFLFRCFPFGFVLVYSVGPDTGSVLIDAHDCRQAFGGCRPSPGGDKSKRHLALAEFRRTQSSLRSPSPSLAKQAGLIPTIRGSSVKTSSRALRQADSAGAERGRAGGPAICIMPFGSELVCWPDSSSEGAQRLKGGLGSEMGQQQRRGPQRSWESVRT